MGESNHLGPIYLSSRASPKGPLPPGFSTFSVVFLHSWSGRLKLESGELPQGGRRQQELWRGTRQQKRDSERVANPPKYTHSLLQLTLSIHAYILYLLLNEQESPNTHTCILYIRFSMTSQATMRSDSPNLEECPLS